MSTAVNRESAAPQTGEYCGPEAAASPQALHVVLLGAQPLEQAVASPLQTIPGMDVITLGAGRPQPSWEAHLRAADLIVDCNGRPAARVRVEQIRRELGTDVVWGAIRGSQCLLGWYPATWPPVYEDPAVGHGCPVSPDVTAAAIAVTGTGLLLEVLRFAHGQEPCVQAAGRSVDVVSDNPWISQPLQRPAVAAQPAHSSLVEAASLELWVDEHPDGLILDLRPEREWREEAIPGSHRASAFGIGGGEAFPSRLQGPCLLYCRDGHTSAVVARQLRSLGWSGVYELAGGFRAWAAVNDAAARHHPGGAPTDRSDG